MAAFLWKSVCACACVCVCMCVCVCVCVLCGVSPHYSNLWYTSETEVLNKEVLNEEVRYF